MHYKSISEKDLFQLFFEPSKELLNSTDKEKFEELKLIFEEGKQPFNWSSESFKPQNMYPFEGLKTFEDTHKEVEKEK